MPIHITHGPLIPSLVLLADQRDCLHEYSTSAPASDGQPTRSIPDNIHRISSLSTQAIAKKRHGSPDRDSEAPSPPEESAAATSPPKQAEDSSLGADTVAEASVNSTPLPSDPSSGAEGARHSDGVAYHWEDADKSHPGVELVVTSAPARPLPEGVLPNCHSDSPQHTDSPGEAHTSRQHFDTPGPQGSDGCADQEEGLAVQPRQTAPHGARADHREHSASPPAPRDHDRTGKVEESGSSMSPRLEHLHEPSSPSPPEQEGLQLSQGPIGESNAPQQWFRDRTEGEIINPGGPTEAAHNSDQPLASWRSDGEARGSASTSFQAGTLEGVAPQSAAQKSQGDRTWHGHLELRQVEARQTDASNPQPVGLQADSLTHHKYTVAGTARVVAAGNLGQGSAQPRSTPWRVSSQVVFTSSQPQQEQHPMSHPQSIANKELHPSATAAVAHDLPPQRSFPSSARIHGPRPSAATPALSVGAGEPAIIPPQPRPASHRLDDAGDRAPAAPKEESAIIAVQVRAPMAAASGKYSDSEIERIARIMSSRP